MGVNKATKMKDISGLSDADLTARIAEDREILRKTEFTHAVSSSENPMSIRVRRRDIARGLTEVSKRKNALKK